MKKRRLVFIPEIHPGTFLLFFSTGDSGRAYTFRDYSVVGRVAKTDSSQYPWSAQEVLAMARWSFDAPRHRTEDLEFWGDEVRRLNALHLGSTRFAEAEARPSAPQPAANVRTPRPRRAGPSGWSVPEGSFNDARKSEPAFPLLAPDRLFAHPVKGAKRQDLERIVTSPASEDWVTWSVLQLLELLDARRWWPEVVTLARAENPGLDFEADREDPPQIELWRSCPTPPAYERSSRARMASSANSDLRNRAGQPAPVEGATEVDIVLEGRGYLIFIEAKLGSDISMTTTYDPARNQVARNIDVLLESAGNRDAAFWMFVRDTAEERAYVQLLREYRENPRSLHALLPHRTAGEVEKVARRLALVRWADLIDLVEREVQAVVGELRGRTSPGGR